MVLLQFRDMSQRSIMNFSSFINMYVSIFCSKAAHTTHNAVWLLVDRGVSHYLKSLPKVILHLFIFLHIGALCHVLSAGRAS